MKRQENSFRVEFYTTLNGEKPARDFIIQQDKKMQAKILGMIELLEEYGNQLREPYSKYLNDGIYELRIKLASDITRVLYFFYCEGRIVLTNGFVKKTLKTPKGEMARAKRYREDFFRQEEHYE